MNQDDYIKQLETQIDELQKKYGEYEVLVNNYEQLMNTIISRSKLHRYKANGSITVETMIALDAVSIIKENNFMAAFVTKALVECEQQEAAELALALFIESGAHDIELPDIGLPDNG